MFWLGILVALILILLYFFVVRPILVTQPTFSKLFKEEASFLEKTQAKLVGWRTKIFARLIMLAGLFVGLYDQALPFVTGQDWTSITDDLPKWVPPVGIAVIGIIVEWLRRSTQNPPQVITTVDPVTQQAQVVGLIQPMSPLPPISGDSPL